MDVVDIGRFGILEVTCLTVGPWRTNCYLIRDGKAGWLIDPGDEGEALLHYVSCLEVVVTRILLTHAHFDHVGAAHALAKHFSLSCELHPADTRLLKLANVYAAKFRGARLEIPHSPTALADGDELRLAGEVFAVQHLPGHTAGGVAFLGTKLTFSGDTLLAGRVGRTDLPGSDPYAINQSVSRLLDAVSDECLICPGHGRPWRAADTKAWWRERSAAKV